MPPARAGRGVGGRRARKTCSKRCHREKDRRRKLARGLRLAASVLMAEADRIDP